MRSAGSGARTWVRRRRGSSTNRRHATSACWSKASKPAVPAPLPPAVLAAPKRPSTPPRSEGASKQNGPPHLTWHVGRDVLRSFARAASRHLFNDATPARDVVADASPSAASALQRAGRARRTRTALRRCWQPAPRTRARRSTFARGRKRPLEATRSGTASSQQRLRWTGRHRQQCQGFHARTCNLSPAPARRASRLTPYWRLRGSAPPRCQPPNRLPLVTNP